MYDTVVASIEADLIDESVFPVQSTTDNVVRMWRNPSAGKYEPRLTYWRSVDGGAGRLRIEFSIPKMAGIDPLSNPDRAATDKALAAVDQFIWRLIPMMPHVSQWQAQRIDYAWNFPIDSVAQYIVMLQGLWLGKMIRQPHPDAEGVVWKSKQAGHRWVKFYNKAREIGLEGSVLRFEVSNYRRSLDYMCQKWFGCGRSVGELLHPGRALYCMARMWSRLGLFAASWHNDGGLLLKLRELFGQSAPGAMYALMCISQYGADAYKVYHLMSDNSYYAWKRKLSEHDLLVSSDVYLPPLSLPASEALNELDKLNGQNLKILSSPHIERVSKIPPKNWQMWCERLQIAKKSPEIGRFTAQLELTWEQIYGEKPAKLRGQLKAG